MQVKTIGTDKDNGYNASQHLIVKVKAPKISGEMKVHPMSTTDRLRCEGTLTIGGYDKTIFAGHAVKKNGQWIGELTQYGCSQTLTTKQLALANQAVEAICLHAENDSAFFYEMESVERWYIQLDIEDTENKISLLQIQTAGLIETLANLTFKLRANEQKTA
jgi:hypothetical protein